MKVFAISSLIVVGVSATMHVEVEPAGEETSFLHVKTEPAWKQNNACPSLSGLAERNNVHGFVFNNDKKTLCAICDFYHNCVRLAGDDGAPKVCDLADAGIFILETNLQLSWKSILF